MNLEELKKSMSTLDDVLAQKGGDAINFNASICHSAQARVARQYRRNILMCSVLAAVFTVLWLSRTDNAAFPVAMKGFLGIYMAVAAMLYAVLYCLIKKIRITSDTPMAVMQQVSSLRLYTLTVEIVLAIVLVVFFTIFLGNLWTLSAYRFWLVAGAIFACVIIGAIMLPGKIKDFRELTAID